MDHFRAPEDPPSGTPLADEPLARALRDGDIAAPPDRPTLAARYGERLAADLLACASAAPLREPLATLGFCDADAPDSEVIEAYFSAPGAMLFSPNALFDELWYRGFYPDVAAAIRNREIDSGFIHFVNSGGAEGRWPNAGLQALALETELVGPVQSIVDGSYADNSKQAHRFLRHFPIFTATQHYNLFGRFLGIDSSGIGSNMALDRQVGKRDAIEAEFDAQYYRARYMTGRESERLRDNPFLHYVVEGVRAGYSPNDWFDETWYRAFYPEVREAIEDGRVPSGFYHYLIAGRAEGRAPSFSQEVALEARSPGVTRPVLIDRLANIEGRRKPVAARLVERDAPVVWFLFPTINPDLSFGGYGAGFELLRAVRAAGHAVAIVCTEDRNATKDYFVFREASQGLRRLVQEIPVVNSARGERLEVAAADRFVAYSTWDLWIAADLVALTGGSKPFLLAQEFEPIFYDHGSVRAVVEEAFTLPHVPIVNSRFLLDYFRSHKVGVFADPAAVEGRDYAVFEHRIGTLPSQTAGAMAGRRRRVLAAYARPEGHAARNMFEVLVLALREICQKGLLGPEWLILGVGALIAHDPMPLGGRHELKIVPRMSEEEYHAYFGALDVGISLMFAPHPSVMPFEFATTGALVVTNTFENRSADDLRAICGNLVPCRPTVSGVVQALEEAIARVGDAAERERNAYRPRQTSWADIFSDDFVTGLLGQPPAAAH